MLIDHYEHRTLDADFEKENGVPSMIAVLHPSCTTLPLLLNLFKKRKGNSHGSVRTERALPDVPFFLILAIS